MDCSLPDPRLQPVRPLAPDASRALEGAVFPLGRGHLLHIARENEAPRTLLTLFAQLPDRVYPSLEIVQASLSGL